LSQSQELDRELMHVASVPEEHDALMAEIRAHVAGNLAARFTTPASTVDMLH
jgi:hypothetical protein